MRSFYCITNDVTTVDMIMTAVLEGAPDVHLYDNSTEALKVMEGYDMALHPQLSVVEVMWR